jgi:hypothetical protein
MGHERGQKGNVVADAVDGEGIERGGLGGDRSPPSTTPPSTRTVTSSVTPSAGGR